MTLADAPADGTLLHTGVAPSVELVVLLGLAGLGSAVVLALALAALFRRRTRSYLLVALALSTLLARTAVAALSAVGTVGAESHHVLEHGLDVVMAALVVAAVYDARSARRGASPSERPDATPRTDDSPRIDDPPKIDDPGGEEP